MALETQMLRHRHCPFWSDANNSGALRWMCVRIDALELRAGDLISLQGRHRRQARKQLSSGHFVHVAPQR
jgi:hypothetical protein